MIKLAIIGYTGKLGSVICEHLQNNKSFKITNKLNSSNILELNDDFDILLDVSNFNTTNYYFEYCLKHNKKIIIGIF